MEAAKRRRTEIRCSSVRSAMAQLETEAACISVGSESCLLKLPRLEEVGPLIRAAADCGKELKCVLPFVPQCHLEEIERYMKDWMEAAGRIHFVVNDYGILHYLSRTAAERVTLTIGRFLERSFELLPWKDHVIRDECEDIRRTVTSSTFAHAPKLRLLQQLGVSGIELNCSPSFAESCRIIQASGMKVSVHAGGSTLAYTRACPIRRITGMEKGAAESCSERCASPMELSFSRKWIPVQGHQEGRSFDEYVDDPEVRSLFPSMYVKGNLIYRKAMEYREDPVLADCWIMEDWAIHNPESVLGLRQ